MAGLALLVSTMPPPGMAVAQSVSRALGARAGADAAAAAVAKSAIQDCLTRVAEETRGLLEIEKRCPDLLAALTAAGIRPLVIDSSRARFDRSSLSQLPSLMHPAAGPAPSVAALAPILRGLRGTTAPPRSWWQRLWDWLSEHLAPRQQPDSSFPWLSGVLRSLARLQWLWAVIIWGTIIALPVAVAIIVLREVRAMGKRSIDDAPTSGKVAAAGPVQSRLALLRQLPPGQRPAQLFAMLIARLVAAGRLPPDRSLTHREVARRALLDDGEQRRLIESLALLSERQLYCGLAGTPTGFEQLLSRGEDLYTTGWSRPAES